MSSRNQPDFSAIRSASERAEAERGFEVGYEIAEGLVALGAFLRRLLDSWTRASVRRAAQRARVIWE